MKNATPVMLAAFAILFAINLIRDDAVVATPDNAGPVEPMIVGTHVSDSRIDNDQLLYWFYSDGSVVGAKVDTTTAQCSPSVTCTYNVIGASTNPLREDRTAAAPDLLGPTDRMIIGTHVARSPIDNDELLYWFYNDGSVVGAKVDITSVPCSPTATCAYDVVDACIADINLDGSTDVEDLLAVVNGWGQCGRNAR